MGRQYKNPPIVEALCEFQFIPGQSWDMTLFGLIYEKVKDKFPVKKQQIGINVQFLPSEKGLEHKVEPAPPRLQFHKQDGSALIQIAPDLLVVNQLRPYPSWNKFKPLILENFEVYRSVALPKSLKRIGLRYINTIELDEQPIELEEYFRFYPYIPDSLPQTQDSFINRVEFPYEAGKERLIVTLATVIPRKPEILSIILDLDYVMATPEYISLNEVSEWLEKAHDRLEKTFEACITDKAREIFKEDKQ